MRDLGDNHHQLERIAKMGDEYVGRCDTCKSQWTMYLEYCPVGFEAPETITIPCPVPGCGKDEFEREEG